MGAKQAKVFVEMETPQPVLEFALQTTAVHSNDGTRIDRHALILIVSHRGTKVTEVKIKE